MSYLNVDDFKIFVERAKSFEMKIYRGPLEVKEIGRTICQLEDPFGNVIGVEG